MGALVQAALLPFAATPKKKPALEAYALVSGSVFQNNGYALPDVDVSIAPEAQAGGAPKNPQPIELVSNARGEFIARVAPGPAQYIVIVRAKGYQTRQKSVSVQDQERVEVTFQLQRESK